jgi:hypothetical protein
MSEPLTKNWSLHKKIKYFYGVCLPLRISIGIFVIIVSLLYPESENPIAWLVWAGAIIAIFLNYMQIKLQKKTFIKIWWSRKVHLWLSFILLLLSILSLVKIIKTYPLGIVIIIDALFGFFSSFYPKK